MDHPTHSRRKHIALGLGLGSVVLIVALLIRGPVGQHFTGPKEPPVIVSTGTIKDGDVLAKVLMNQGLGAQYVNAIQATFTKFKQDVRFIKPGHTYEIVTSTDGIFRKFIYHPDSTSSYVITRSTLNVYTAEKTTEKTVWKTKRVQGKITDSLNGDLIRQGYDPAFVELLVNLIADKIFAWRIDFFTEPRAGDTYEILLEQEYIESTGKPIRSIRVLAAKYNGKATRVKENIAIRYQPAGSKQAEYYDQEGGAVRRVFLRAPFTYGGFRVSSGFNPKRMHPILRTYRPHHGTDYAAARGTPAAAIGKGVVVRAEWYKGYGNCVDIRHSNRYTSRYGHLSKILVKHGQTVDQGRTIGLVGSTGLSTGPHLHFEMLVDGKQQNFLRMNFPAAASVAKGEMSDFSKTRDEFLMRLQNMTADQPSNGNTKPS